MKKKIGATSPFRLEHGSITVMQGTAVFFTFILSTIDIFVPYLIAQKAGRDGWISVFLMMLLNLPLLATILALTLRFPRRNIIEYPRLILGVWPGRLVGLLYLFFILIIGTVTFRELAEFMNIAFLQKTPKIVLGVTTFILTVYATWSGLEVINRVNNIILPVGAFFLLFVGVAVLPQADFKQYLPVMENGLKPPLNASLILLAQVAEGFVLLGMLPFTRHPGRVVGIVAAVLPFIGLALLLGTISIAVFGMTELRKLLMPALELSRIIDIPGLPRSDVLIMAGWYGGIFVKLSVLHYFLVLLCAQYTGLRTYKPLIIPVGIIMLSLSSVIFPNTTDMLNFISGPYTYFLLTFEFVLPLIMLIVSFLRGIEEKEGVH